ncbi:MAG TPA: hypothetical protein V6D29_16775 [Leptolyngbyaceae cyanobacterium]
MTSTDRHLLQELTQKHQQLQSFRALLSSTLQSKLDQCEWSLLPGAGQGGLPLVTLRLPWRVSLGDPFLVALAEQTLQAWGAVDFSLFSGESPEPVRVLNRTLLDRRWPWREA